MTGAPEICAVILAAGEGRRLRPLTAVRPKALCPVGGVTLLDRALQRLAGLGLTGPQRVAVNASHLAKQVVVRVHDRALVSVEHGEPLGTAGGLGNLRDWINGRAVLVGNADAYLWASDLAPGPDVASLLDGWDGSTVRLLGVPATTPGAAEFGRHRFAGFSLLPWADVVALAAQRSHLVLTTWRPAERADRLEVIEYSGSYLDTGTPRDYLAANLHAAAHAPSGGSSAAGSLVAEHAVVLGQLDRAVIGGGARVEGDVTRGVVWPGGYVGPDEHLVDAIRVGRNVTVRATDVDQPLGVDTMS